jgi:hypothetical protein
LKIIEIVTRPFHSEAHHNSKLEGFAEALEGGIIPESHVKEGNLEPSKP